MSISINFGRNVVVEHREVPIVKMVDVIVAGGSPTGVSAAVAAARNGAETLLVERYGFLGGTMTAGMVPSPNRLPSTRGKTPSDEEPFLRSIFVEMLRRSVNAAGLKHSWEDVDIDDVTLNPEVFKYVLLKMVEEAGVKLLLHTFVFDTIVNDGVVKGIVVENKAGHQALLGKVVVDATGDGDVAARAGVPHELRPVKDRWGPGWCFLIGNVDIEKTFEYLKEHPDQYVHKWYWDMSFEEFERRVQADHNVGINGFYSLVKEASEKGDFVSGEKQVGFTWLGGGIVSMGVNLGTINDPPRFDCLNPDDLTNAETIARKHAWMRVNFFKKYVPGFEEASLIVTPVHIGVRETRRIMTEHVLKAEDVKASREFEDTVIYIPSVPGWMVNHVMPFHAGREYWTEEVVGDLSIPYRTLIPRGVENLLIAGRCVAYFISSGAFVGQVAGTAAALAVKAGITPRQLDVPILQKTLREQGFVYASLKA